VPAVENPYILATSSEYTVPLGTLTVTIPKSRVSTSPNAGWSAPIKGKRYFDSRVSFTIPFPPANGIESKALHELTPPWIKELKTVLVVQGSTASIAPGKIVNSELTRKGWSLGAPGCTLHKDSGSLDSLERFSIVNCEKEKYSSLMQYIFVPAENTLKDFLYIECSPTPKSRTVTGTCMMSGYPGDKIGLHVFFPMDVLYRWSEIWSLAKAQLRVFTVANSTTPRWDNERLGVDGIKVEDMRSWYPPEPTRQN
jgi:hypothetical protein